MENSNLQIFQAEALIDQAITNLPVGEAYMILRMKMLQIQKLYHQQVQAEYAAAQSKTTQDQDNVENDLAAAQQEEEN